MNAYSTPFDYAEWRAFKAATRHRRYLQRLIDGDQERAADWLAAVERDDRTDPYERRVMAQGGRV